MDLRFSEIIKSFLPVGKIWEQQENTTNLINGMSDEFGRLYTDAVSFYNNFNIVKSYELASEHGNDYLIKSGLFTGIEIQRIIVQYLNKDMDFKEIIQDFADFINASVTWGVPQYFEIGFSQCGDELGGEGSPAILFVILDASNVTCSQYRKIKWLVEYLKPPYLHVLMSDPPLTGSIPFEIGYSQCGDSLEQASICS